MFFKKIIVFRKDDIEIFKKDLDLCETNKITKNFFGTKIAKLVRIYFTKTLKLKTLLNQGFKACIGFKRG